MLFTAVTELFGHLAQLPALDEAFEALRRGSPAEQLAGLTNPVKALVVAWRRESCEGRLWCW